MASKQKEKHSEESDSLKDKTNLHPVRSLLIFQVKLAVDALRDILLSPVSIVASLIDLVDGRKGKDSYFEMLMTFGRNSESKINLFGQHDGEKQTIDNILNQVEDVLRKEYKQGDITAKTKSAIEAKLKINKP
jgi:hypothetical protein